MIIPRKHFYLEEAKELLGEKSVQYTAKEIGYSLSRFGKLFKMSTGVSPYRHRRKLLLKKAKRVLLNCGSVQQACEKAGYSTADYFSGVFKKEAGISPLRYKTKFRIRKAKQLIMRSVPPGEIWKETGFGSVNHLGMAFKKETGMTPTEYGIKLKIERAKQLLERMPVGEVYKELGYKSDYFCILFKRETSRTLSKYRQHVRMQASEQSLGL